MSEYGELIDSPSDGHEQSARWRVVIGVLAVIVLLGGLLVVLADDGGSGGDPAVLLSGAPDAARDAGTARIAMTTSASGLGISMDVVGEGLIDFETGNMTFEMQMFGTSMEMRAVDRMLYLRLPEAGRSPGMTHSWVGMPAEAGAGFTGPPLTGAGGFLDALRGMSDDVTELGRNEVNGYEATGYRVTIDMARAVEQAPESSRDELEDALSQMRAMGLERWPMEVWVTDEGLPVRMVMETPVQQGLEVRVQIDLTDFGIDVDIERPPSEDTLVVTDITDLNGLLGPGFNPFASEPAAA